MDNRQDGHGVAFELIDNQIGKAADDKFARPFQQSSPADLGMLGQGFDLFPDGAGDAAACGRAVLGDVLPNLYQVLNRGFGSADDGQEVSPSRRSSSANRASTSSASITSPAWAD